MKGYFASHFFNDAMFQWTEDFTRAIEVQTQLDLYVPQRNADISDKKNEGDTIAVLAISKADTQKFKKAHILIACLDGLNIDDGVAAEVTAHRVMAEFEANHGTHSPRLTLGILTDMGPQGSGDSRLHRNQMIIEKVQEHGRVIHGYPGEKICTQETIQAIQEFMKEH